MCYIPCGASLAGGCPGLLALRARELADPLKAAGARVMVAPPWMAKVGWAWVTTMVGEALCAGGAFISVLLSGAGRASACPQTKTSVGGAFPIGRDWVPWVPT